MITKEFQEEYGKLNSEQKKAVDTIEGPVLVIAGPGTGKTQVLTLRIANILVHTDTRPENILALTFTEAAATNMRKRLSRIIGAPAYRVRIETFHSFCNDIIKTYPESFPTIIGSSHITEVETAALIEELIGGLTLSMLRPWGDPLFYVREIISKIAELKREGLTPQEYGRLVSEEEKLFKSRDDLRHERGSHKGKIKSVHLKYERQILKNKELALIYEAYQKVLRERRYYDWSDMIMEVLFALQDDEMLKLSLQEEHQYILVDEHQDTNNAQSKIVELLSSFHNNPNLFIVGDSKQAIFRFQGASIENFLYLRERYSNIRIIELSENYRSVQPILDAAHSLLQSDKSLRSNKNPTTEVTIEVVECGDESSELYFVAKEVEKSIRAGREPSEIAILYRNNKDAFGISDMLDRVGVKYVIESDEDLLSEQFVNKFVTLLEAVHNYGENAYLIPVLHIEELGVETLSAYRLIAKSAREKVDVFDLLQQSEDKTLCNFADTLKNWVRASKKKSLMEIFEQILRDSGLLESMLRSKDADSFLGIERLFEEVKRIAQNRPEAKLEEFIEYLTILKTHKIFLRRPKHNVKLGAVRLMTAHRSKGLEFEEVFIIKCNEDSFGDGRKLDYLPLLPSIYKKSTADIAIERSSIDDERRLFYVCITRAKERVVISYRIIDNDGREALPSVFITEIRQDLLKRTEAPDIQKELLFKEKINTKELSIDKEFIKELFENQSFSVTALNNYLNCPWKYFYRNLLRVPSLPAKHQIYGTAMHRAVQDLFAVRTDREVDSKFLTDSFIRHLSSAPLNHTEKQEAEKRGIEALSGWYKWANTEWRYPSIPEFSVTAPLDNILLYGKLDKVEFLDELHVKVYDYKTGKQKTRNEIEGKTKGSNGDMKRQLVFYNLLLNLHDTGKLKMDRGVVEFLEPNDTGNYRREEFEITQSEITELQEIIKKVVSEITSIAFWSKNCNDKDCEYCSFRKMIRS